MFYTAKITVLTAAAFLLLLLITCKKDPYLPIGNGDCYTPQPKYALWLTQTFDTDPIGYHMPCFNPNNPKEFCYLFAKQGVGGQLRKHNLQTGEDKLIYPISFSAPPKWNKNGKITFASGYQVYTIDEDGKNIKKLTTIPYNMYPAWLNDTTIICYYSKYFPNSTQSLRININSNTIDTLEVGGSIFDVAKDGKILSPGTPYLFYSTYKGFCEQQLWEYKVQTHGTDSRCAVWHPNSEDIFYTAAGWDLGGLFKVNIYSKQSTLILPHCPSRRYSNITVSPDGKWIIAERQTMYYRNFVSPNGKKVNRNSAPFHKYTLELMDINGNNRMELKLPE
ncbi:MAG: hypothetical protein HJHJAOHD_01337 [Flavobacteriales bacterium]|nr:hypothetical protein [Flavobacteriales bacterium]WKZ75377.1 MAG: hypothetical protein QY303_00490 [Vicingaceae bacterium]